MKYFIDKYIRKAKFEYVRTQGFTSGTVTCFILWTPPYFAELEEQLMSLPHNLQMKIVFDKMCASKVIRTSYHSRFLFMEVALAPFIVKVERSRIGCIKEYLDPYDVQMNSLQTGHVQHGVCIFGLMLVARMTLGSTSACSNFQWSRLACPSNTQRQTVVSLHNFLQLKVVLMRLTLPMMDGCNYNNAVYLL